MTEAKWMTCCQPDDLLPMMEYLIDGRKRRLFACACCRHIWRFITDERSRKAVDAVERHAGGLSAGDALADAVNAACDAGREYRPEYHHSAACWAVSRLDDTHDKAVLYHLIDTICTDGLNHLFPLIRELIGNPFRAVALNPSWLTWNDGTVRKLALAVYDDRAFDRLPLLADALEDADCESRELLDHCRAAGEHVRGCWAVDLLLGKG